jgi:hypothetical protein
MTQRTRKLIGTVALLVLIIVYSLVAMVLASALLDRFGVVGRTLVYLVGGLAWVPPAMLIVSWMHGGRSDKHV